MNEMIRWSCSTCGKRLKASPEQTGRKARCACGTLVVVPEAAAEVRQFANGDLVERNRWAAESPPITTLRRAPAECPTSVTDSRTSHEWISSVAAAPEHSFELRYRGDFRTIWQSILAYVGKLPDLTVLQMTELPLQLIYRSHHFRQIVVVNVSSASKAGETDIALHLFADLTQPELTEHKNPATRLFAYAGLKTHALDPNFRQTGGVGGPNEVRSSGVWKMVGGAGICLVGLILTALTQGQVLFYGAIIWGGFMFIAGLVQTIIGRKVD